MHFNLRTTVVLTLLLYVSLPASGQQLVVNGGFETGNFSGWTQSGNAVFAFVTSDPSFVHSGNYGAALGSIGSDGYLDQNLATQAGQRYNVSFWLNGDGTTPNDFSAAFGAASLFSGVNIPSTNGWKQFNYTVTASSNNTDLHFGFREDPSYFGLDDVRVAPVPEFGSVVGLGSLVTLLGALSFRRRRRSNRS